MPYQAHLKMTLYYPKFYKNMSVFHWNELPSLLVRKKPVQDLYSQEVLNKILGDETSK